MSNNRIETVPVSGPFRLTGNFRSISLSVSAVPGIAEATFTISGYGPRAAEMIAATQVDFDGTTLHFEAPERPLLGMMSQIRFAVTIPSGADVEVRGSSGSCDLAGELNNVDVQNHSGSIRVDSADSCYLQATSGSLSVRSTRSGTLGSHSGSITVNDAGWLSATATSGSLRIGDVAAGAELQTTSGTIHGQHIRGEISAQSSSGSIRLAAAAGSLRAGTTSGSIVIRRFEGGAVDARATSGSVKIGIPFGIALKADAQAASGHVSSDLEPVAGPEGFEGAVDAFVRTGSGNISFTRVA